MLKKLNIKLTPKFGGFSGLNPEIFMLAQGEVNRLRNNLEDTPEYTERMLVIRSAFGPTTRWLEEAFQNVGMCKKAEERLDSILSSMISIKNLFCKFTQRFNLPLEFHDSQMELIENELEECATDPALAETDARTYNKYLDQVRSLGEMVSTNFYSAILKTQKVEHLLIPAEEVFETDDTCGYAVPQIQKITKNLGEFFEDHEKKNGKIPQLLVMSGYIGKYCGHPHLGQKFRTTLGKNESDFTASIMSYILGLPTLLYKDVAGIKRQLLDKNVISEISPEEALPICKETNGKPIGVRCLKFSDEYDVEILIRSLYEPFVKGTTIRKPKIKVSEKKSGELQFLS